MLQTEYSGEEEESNDENRNWEGKWKYLLLSRKKAENCGEKTDGVWKFARCETFALTFETCSDASKHWCRIFAPAQLVSQAPSQHLIQAQKPTFSPRVNTGEDLK